MAQAGSSALLLLVPTAMERDRLLGDKDLRDLIDRAGVKLQLCGFGPISSAAVAAAAISNTKFDGVVLAGIAGCYGDRLDIGTAYLFEQVACWGVGAGSDESFQASPRMGFSQLGDSVSAANPRDLLELNHGHPGISQHRAGLLLTCCSAAGDLRDCRQRLDAFPEAMAEDMEGFGVAVACQLAAVPLTIIRGISNRAGDRQISRWQIAPALSSTANLLSQLLSGLSKQTKHQ